jgi:hypothetical protein
LELLTAAFRPPALQYIKDVSKLIPTGCAQLCCYSDRREQGLNTLCGFLALVTKRTSTSPAFELVVVQHIAGVLLRFFFAELFWIVCFAAEVDVAAFYIMYTDRYGVDLEDGIVKTRSFFFSARSDRGDSWGCL